MKHVLIVLLLNSLLWSQTMTVSPASSAQTIADAVAQEATIKQHMSIELGPGTFLTPPINLSDDGFCENILGAGQNVTRIKPVGVNTTALISKGSATTTQRCRIENLTIDMNGQTGKCFDIQRMKGLTLINVECVGSTNDTSSASLGYTFAGAGNFEIVAWNLSIAVPITMPPATRTAYCLQLQQAVTDSSFYNVKCNGARIAGAQNKGAATHWYDFHPYGPLGQLYCVEDYGRNSYIGTECDVFQNAAFDWFGLNSIASSTQLVQATLATWPNSRLAHYENSAGRNDMIGVITANAPNPYNVDGNAAAIAASFLQLNPVAAQPPVISPTLNCTITVPSLSLQNGTATGIASLTNCK